LKFFCCLGNKIDIKAVKENRTADIPIYITDSSKFMQVSGWKPAKTPQDIVQDIYDWIKKDEALLAPILNP
jgi:CDP-paratose 2-epimerase